MKSDSPSRDISVGDKSTPQEEQTGDEKFEPSEKELKWKIKRELVVILYTAKVFLPNILSHPIFMIIQMALPFTDYGTDYWNAGQDIELVLMV